MRKLSNVTLLSIDCYKYGQTVDSLKKSMSQCSFDKVMFFTDIDIKFEGVEVVKIPKITSKAEYSRFVIKELFKYIQTDYVLVTQWDGWILNSGSWDDKFFEFDGVGSAWLYDERNNFNGGFCLMSEKLLTVLGTDDFIEVVSPDGEIIGRLYRNYLIEKHGIKFPDDDTCDRFSFELREPIYDTFGFHSFFHQPYKPSVVIKREASLGDVIMCEPIISYYFERGCNVYLDTLPEFMDVFFQYRYPLRHISQMDKRIVPVKTINLDMAYESKPTQPVLKSYFEFAETTDRKYRNSQLDLIIDQNAYLFSKYILIHIDDTGLSHRNQHGINWNFVVEYYKRLGYQVFQIGKRTKEMVAPHFNTATLQMLMLAIKGAGLLIGIDSSPAQIAVALNVPAVIMFGSVNPHLRYTDFSKIQVVHTDCPTSKETYCYHHETGTTGVKCIHNEEMPPCTVYNEFEIIGASNKLLSI